MWIGQQPHCGEYRRQDFIDFPAEWSTEMGIQPLSLVVAKRRRQKTVAALEYKEFVINGH